MKKILDLISEEVMQAFEAAGYEKNWVKYLSLTDLIYVNISAMAPWQVPRNIRKLLS